MRSAYEKSLDAKLSRILADPACGDFILADAKDADMAFGLAAPGLAAGGTPGQGPFRSIHEYRESIREIVAEGLVDIMLMSASTSEVLAIDERLFDQSPVTPAARMNDTTDIWLASGTGGYARQPALSFATTTISQARWGTSQTPPTAAGNAPYPGANLGLFSITLNDDAVLDRDMLAAYREFRLEAEREGFRHFLEVFYPNAPGAVPGKAAGAQPANVARFLADHVVRALAGVPRAGRPVFLKIPYLGPEVMEQLAAYDRTLVVGVLGGGAGTTHDAFALIADAKRHGARVALFGRKINAAEHQPTFVRHLRLVADGDLAADEGVRAYHGALAKLGIRPQRGLDADLARAPVAQAYGG
jgi:hypothetical protein